MTTRLTNVRVLATWSARGLHQSPVPSRRGRRESRVRAAPAVSCASLCKGSAHEHTGPAEAFRLSLREWLFGLLRALPGDRLFATVICESSASAKLSASTGAPGPHDFTVRVRHVRLS